MSSKTSGSRDFQDHLLSKMIQRGQVATIYLRNRMSLRGRVLEFDSYVLLLEPSDGGPTHMVYKSAIVSVSGPKEAEPVRRPRPAGDALHGESRPELGQAQPAHEAA